MGGENIPKQPWRELAKQILRQTDHAKILEMARELIDQMDEYFRKVPLAKTSANSKIRNTSVPDETSE